MHRNAGGPIRMVVPRVPTHRTSIAKTSGSTVFHPLLRWPFLLLGCREQLFSNPGLGNTDGVRTWQGRTHPTPLEGGNLRRTSEKMRIKRCDADMYDTAEEETGATTCAQHAKPSKGCIGWKQRTHDQ